MVQPEKKLYVYSEKRFITLQGQDYAILLTADPEDGGFVCECPDLPGCFSQGESREEALDNMASAIVDWLGEEQPQRARA